MSSFAASMKYENTLKFALASGSFLAALNLALKAYTAKNPKSVLNKDMDDGCDRQIHHYMAPLVIMNAGCFFTAAAVLNAREGGAKALQEWWFGNTGRMYWAYWMATGLGVGHYSQDMLCNWKTTTVPLAVHHSLAVVHAACVQSTSVFGGMLLAWSGTYEAGSLILNLGYLGILPRAVGHWAGLITTVVGCLFGVHGLLSSGRVKELRGPGWFSLVALVLMAYGRIDDALYNIKNKPWKNGSNGSALPAANGEK